MNLIDEILELEESASLETPATEQMLTEFQTSLNGEAPLLLLDILKRSNGGEFSFLRFEPSPFLAADGTDIWTHVQSIYPASPLIENREFLPLGNDYGDALICLSFRTKPASVYLVPYYSRSEDEFELLGADFEEFLRDHLQILQREARRKTETVRISLDEADEAPKLKDFGVRFKKVDLDLVIADEKRSSFPNETMLEYFQKAEHCLCYTFQELEDSGDKEYGVVNAAMDLKPVSARKIDAQGVAENLATGIRYLMEPGTYSSYPVWTVVSERPWGRTSYLEVEFEFLEATPKGVGS